MIIDPYYNRVEAGFRYDLSPEEVISYCEN
jgi:hypothetical protein